MRIAAAIFVMLLGASAACAQGNARAPQGAKATAATSAKAKAKPARVAKPATAKPEAKPAPSGAVAAKPRPSPAKPKAEVARPRPGVAKPRPETAAPKPRIAAAKPEQATRPAPAPVEKPDVTATVSAGRVDQSLRESYAAIPLAERIALQSDLIWTGDYNGLLSGEFSDGLVEAVKSYQRRQNAKITGLPSPQERAALRASAQPRQDEVGWRLVEDPASGARVGLPLKLATKHEPAPTGTRWSSQQGQLQIETFRIDTGATLDAVFEAQKKSPPQRRVTTNVLRSDSFVLSGTQGLKKFTVRGAAQNGEVRGITILYDQAEAHMDSIVVAMGSAFAPFATHAVASADAPARKRVEYASGVVVSASGYIVTARAAVEGCHVIVVPGLGNAERVVEETGGELALLRVHGARKLAPIGIGATASPTGPATLVGIADPHAQAGGAAVTTAAAKLGAGGAALLALEPPPAPGFSGATALDGKGELLGVVVLKPAVVAGTGGGPQAAVVPAATLRKFLEAHQVALPAGQGGTEDAKAAVVRVICVRK